MIKKDFLKNNIEEYDRKYLQLGYGIKYPESHVVRLSKYFKNKNSILDFGCGNGTHLHFFSDLKINKIYGVDTSKIVNSIKSKKFKTFRINEKDDLIKIVKKKVDIVFSNQVLYYLDNETLSFYFNQFNNLLKKKGLIVTTWMAKKGLFYKSSKKIKNSEMRKLKFKSRLKETTYINFKTKKEINKILEINNFKSILFGHYDVVMNHDQVDSGGYHYINISKKIK